MEKDIEYEDFKNRHLQHPITFLTEENLDKLEAHCRKAIRYERGVEHKVVFELLERYKEFLVEKEQDKKKIKELEAKLEEANRQLDLDYVDKNYIPVKKVINKKESLKDDLKHNRCRYPYIIEKQIDILEEILEDK